MAIGLNQRAQFLSVFSEVIPFKATVNFASAADGVGETVAVSVPGAALGDFVLVSPSLDLQDMLLGAYVASAGSVELRLQNESGGVVDLASQTINGVVLKQGPVFDGL